MNKTDVLVTLCRMHAAEALEVDPTRISVYSDEESDGQVAVVLLVDDKPMTDTQIDAVNAHVQRLLAARASS